MEQDQQYHAFWYKPRDGSNQPIDTPQPDSTGTWMLHATPAPLDWVLVVEKR
ncbi:MAG TPA: hypothetical protein DCM54_10675 [Gammaproteobacteria bacterium]|nr:hypothetical protein [Gammaproteobacteria bacterium]